MQASMMKVGAGCSAFFLLPGLAYSLVTSRLPAIKVNAGLSDLEIGSALFLLGLAATLGLFFNYRALRLLGDRAVLSLAALLMATGVMGIGFAANFTEVSLSFILLGVSIGFIDSSANAQGMNFEAIFKKRSMNLFHAFYSLGAIVGSLAASYFASRNLSPAVNFAGVFIPFLLLALYLARNLLRTVNQSQEKQSDQSDKKRYIPWFILFCGIMTLLAYAIEGSAGEWGALYLTQCKDAQPSLAALVYGMVSATVFTVRLFADKLRSYLGDALLISICCVLILIGMLSVIFSPTPYFALGGYLLMGVGLSPIVPTFFSLGGKCSGIPLSRSSSIIGTIAYSGLLVVPPTLGWLAEHVGLENAFYFVVFLILVMFILSFRLFFPGTPASPRSTKL